MARIKTINNIKNFKPESYLETFDYQKDLTDKLDRHRKDFDQNVINEILLWKVNRYAGLKQETLFLVNGINPRSKKLDEEKTQGVLRSLLDTKGIRLPVASTILRFRNPQIYQIIDQRAYRVLYGEGMKIPRRHDEQITFYMEYLVRLREACSTYKMSFSEVDRILYEADKVENKGLNIKT